MPHFGPIKRRELIAALRRLGFSGPYAGGRHEFMQRGALSLTIPNPHGSDIGPRLLAKCYARHTCAGRNGSNSELEIGADIAPVCAHRAKIWRMMSSMGTSWMSMSLTGNSSRSALQTGITRSRLTLSCTLIAVFSTTSP